MIPNYIDRLRYDRAAFAREVEYTREAACEEYDDDVMDMALSHFVNEPTTANDAVTFKNFDATLSDVDDSKDEEIQRILNSNSDLSFDDMIGIECDNV